MADFILRDVALSIPDNLLTDHLIAALEAGRYEHTEANALLRHLRPEDRFLDCGAGSGYLCALAARVAGRVAGVEAGPQTAEAARANLARNGVEGSIEWGAIVPDDFNGDSVVFAVTRAFWASSLTPGGNTRVKSTSEVPALRFGAVLERTRPTVISIDIEGGEQRLFKTPLPADVRLIVMEIHPVVYGAAGVGEIFSDLARSGFVYCPAGSTGDTVVFQRLDAGAPA